MLANTNITLSKEEMTIVSLVASMRRSESKSEKRKDNHGFNGAGAWDIEIEGAGAEMAYCKFKNCFWSGSVNSFKSADVGPSIQIRHSVRDDGSLIVRDGDNDKHFYVLVTGIMPNYVIRGWIVGSKAKIEKYRRAPNGRAPAFFVPQVDLGHF